MKSFPFDSEVTYDGQGNPSYDRGVNSQDLAENIALMFTNGVGINPSTNFQVTTSENSMSVEVNPGTCCIEGHLGKEDTVRTIVFEAAETLLDRIDRVVLRLNTNVDYRSIDLYVVKGTPAALPEAPALTRAAGIYELALADVFIARNTTYISGSRITDVRMDSSVCGYTATRPTSIDVTSIFQQYQAALDEYLDFANSCISETVVGEIEESFAPLYDTTETYNEGDLCTHNATFYECQEEGTTGEWDENNWERTSVKKLNDRINNDLSAIDEIIRNLTDRMYPVGSIYLSVSATDPATVFGGTWTQLSGGYVLKTISSGTGGAETAAGNTGDTTLTAAQSGVPAHSHGLNSHTHSIPALSGTTGSHNHSIYSATDTGNGITGYPNSCPSANSWVSERYAYATTAGSGTASVGKTNSVSSLSVTTTANTTGQATGSTANNTAANASAAHNHTAGMPANIAVYAWKRTA